MPIIVRSAPSRRRTEMVAQRLSIWGALRQISSMNAKNTALRRGDWWVAFPPSIRPPELPEETPATANRKGTKLSTSPGRLPVHWRPPPALSSPLLSPHEAMEWNRVGTEGSGGLGQKN
ncbi:PHD finger protein 5A [Phyllostomus discolor]|uniref:PHD finger protein 5A n=1 Tax=Phyllostomus discolor TaxID=89673 RepID=A0A834ENS9_9CHIR|nr:PHD finger protein 5A [Phyllostomus discolor]